MGPVFASADIAAIVAAFPPPSSTRDEPSLIRSKSGNNIYRSSHVHERFRALLATAPERVKLSDLPSRLDVAKTDWLLHLDDEPIFYSRDGHSILSKPEVSRIVQGMFDQSANKLLDESAYASECEVSPGTLRELREREGARNLMRWIDPDNHHKAYIHGAFGGKVRDRVLALTPAAYDEGVDITQFFPDTPSAFLKHQAELAGGERAAAKGKWQLLDRRAVFIPNSYAKTLESKKKAAEEAEMEHYVSELVSTGFCRFPVRAGDEPEFPFGPQRQILLLDLSRRCVTRTGEDGHENGLVEYPINDGEAALAPSLIAVRHNLRTSRETVWSMASEQVPSIWSGRDGTGDLRKLTAATLRKLREKSQGQELQLLLLSSPFATVMESMIEDELRKLQQREHERFQQAIQGRLLAPLQLYTTGISTVQDETLRQHLEDYLGEHFRRDIIPSLRDHLQEQKLLVENATNRDFDKLRETSKDGQGVSDLHASVSKAAKRQKIDRPDVELLRAVKHKTLQDSLRTMQKSKIRGSDLLQNVIWTLLTCAADGLYLSPGKDTSRMIKLYQAVGDVELGAKLERWRDALKAGGGDGEMLRDMRETAAMAVGALTTAQATNGDATPERPATDGDVGQEEDAAA